LDKIGAALCLLVLGSIPYPFFISFVGVMLDLDQWHYVFEAHILPDPTQREIVKHILVPFALRVFACVVAAFEVIRSLLFFFIYVTPDNYQRLLVVSSHRSQTHTFTAYEQYQLMSQMAENLTGMLSALWLSVGHISTVVLLWLTVCGYAKTQYFLLYATYPLMASWIIAFCVLGMERVVALFEVSNETVGNWRAGCVVRESGNGTFELRINKGIRRKARSLKPVGLTVGKMKIVKKGFEIDWLSLLMDHLTNAVLLIKP